MIKPTRVTGLERLELLRLRDRVGRLFAALQEATVAEDPLASGAWAPPVDLCEAEDAIYVRVELPGLNSEHIQIGLTNTQLRIWGEKKLLPREPVSFPHLVQSEVMDVQPFGSIALDFQRPRGHRGACDGVFAHSFAQESKTDVALNSDSQLRVQRVSNVSPQPITKTFSRLMK